MLELNHKKIMICYFLTQGLFWTSYAMVWSFATVFLQYKGYNSTSIGIVSGMGAVLSVIIQPILASMVDKIKVITTKMITEAVAIVSIIISGVIILNPSGIYTIAILFCMILCLNVSLSTLINTVGMEYINRGAKVNFGIARSAGSLFYAIMCFCLGYIVKIIGEGSLIPIFAVTISILLIVLWLMPSIEKKHSNNSTENKISLREFLSGNKSFCIFLLASFFMYMGSYFVSTFMIDIVRRVGGDSSNLGIAYFISALSEVPVIYFFTFLVRKFKIKKLLMFCSLFFVLKLFTIMMAPNITMVYIGMLMESGSLAIFFPASVYYVNQVLEDKYRGMGQALLGAFTMGLGGALGSCLSGKILDVFGLSFLLGCSVILAVIGAILFLIIFLKRKRYSKKQHKNMTNCQDLY